MKADVEVQASYFNERLSVWEPLIEPVCETVGVYRPWSAVIKVSVCEWWCSAVCVGSGLPESLFGLGVELSYVQAHRKIQRENNHSVLIS